MPYSTPEKLKEYLQRTKEARGEYKRQDDQLLKEEHNRKVECSCGGRYAIKHKSIHES
jgi:ubiquitin